MSSKGYEPWLDERLLHVRLGALGICSFALPGEISADHCCFQPTHTIQYQYQFANNERRRR